MKVFNNKPNISHKLEDGTIIWESRSVAIVSTILANYNDNIYILIGKRGNGALDSIGKYNMICGYIDYNESGTEAVYREVYEESGLDLDNYQIIHNNLNEPWYVNTIPTENRQNITLRYGCTIKVDKLPELTNKYSEPNEVSDLKWITIDDIDNYEWAFNHDNILKQYLKNNN